MGTRGIYGIRKDSIDKCFFNSTDSYPSHLGNKVLSMIKNINLEELFNKLIETKNPEEDEVLNNDIQKLYCQDKIVFYNDVDFLKDGLNCEWAYLINLDTNKLEIYKGQYKEKDFKNRYENIPIIIDGEKIEYYIKLVDEIDLKSIRDNINLKFNIGEYE